MILFVCFFSCFFHCWQLICEQTHGHFVFLGALRGAIGLGVLPHNSHIHGCSDPESHFLFDDLLFKAVGVHCDLSARIESPLVGCSIAIGRM